METRVVNRPAVDPAEQAWRLSGRLLWWIVGAPIVGFIAANRLLDPSWPLEQVIPLVIALAAPFGWGAWEGLRAVRLGDRRGWWTTIVHFAFMAIALVLPISEALSI